MEQQQDPTESAVCCASFAINCPEICVQESYDRFIGGLTSGDCTLAKVTAFLALGAELRRFSLCILLTSRNRSVAKVPCEGSFPRFCETVANAGWVNELSLGSPYPNRDPRVVGVKYGQRKDLAVALTSKIACIRSLETLRIGSSLPSHIG